MFQILCQWEMPLNLNHHKLAMCLLLLLLPIYSIATSHQFSTLHDNLEERSSPPSSPPSTSGQSDLQLTIEEVASTLLALDTTKATGPDGIPSRLLKETAWQIAPSLTQIFNKSLSCGEIPAEWKLANIVPVHKKGEKSQVENYRSTYLPSFHNIESTRTLCPEKFT